jgi:hypothetical protein
MAPQKVSRRDLMRLLGASGLAAGIVGTGGTEPAWADPAVRKDAPPGVRVAGTDHSATTLVNGKVIQPQRELAVLHQTDVPPGVRPGA